MKVIFFITHTTLNEDHLNMCLKCLGNQEEVRDQMLPIFDIFYIYNTHEHELSNDLIREYISKYNIRKICKSVEVFQYNPETPKTLGGDIGAIRTFCEKNFQKTDSVLLLKSDIMLSVSILSDILRIDKLNKNSYVFTPPFICAKERVTNDEIYEYTRRERFIPSDNITFFLEDDVGSNNNDYKTGKTPHNNEIKFISCTVKRDFSCHYLTVDNFSKLVVKNQEWGGVNLEQCRNDWLGTVHSFTVHKYHGIKSENCSRERDSNLHKYLTQK